MSGEDTGKTDPRTALFGFALGVAWLYFSWKASAQWVTPRKIFKVK